MTTATQWSRPTVQRRARRRRAGVVGVVAVLLLTLLVVVIARATGDETTAARAATVECRAEACTGEPGETGGAITRSEVAARVQQWLGDTSIGYSMADGHAGPGGWGWYRRDCSGFVSMALRLLDDNGGASTVELADVLTEVPVDELRPYDLIGRLGPDSAGEKGHVQLFLGWSNDAHTKVRVLEQGGLAVTVDWPHEATYAWPEHMADGTALRAYRYPAIRD